MFSFDYTIEIYVPAEKRKFGYYGLPILWKDRLVGQVDMKADRKKNQLLIKNLEINIELKDDFLNSWHTMLLEFLVFQEVEKVVFEHSVAGEYHVLVDASRI